MTLEDHIQLFKDLRILVVGDIMLDRYIFGKVDRLSPEGPVPISRPVRIEQRLGGASNVAYNAHSLGSHTHLYAIVGYDKDGTSLKEIIRNSGIDYSNFYDARKTICKERHIEEERNHMLLRVDYEGEDDTRPIDGGLIKGIINKLKNDISTAPFQCMILSDYDKGMFKSDLAVDLIQIARRGSIQTIAGPKPNNIEKFAYSDVLCLNQKEASSYTGIKYNGVESLGSMAKNIEERLHPNHAVITCGRDGMFIYDAGNHTLIPPRVQRGVFDVTGAGDTVLATLALALACKKYDIRDAAKIANLAAGIAVEQVGTVAIKPEELSDRIRNHGY